MKGFDPSKNLTTNWPWLDLDFLIPSA